MHFLPTPILGVRVCVCHGTIEPNLVMIIHHRLLLFRSTEPTEKKNHTRYVRYQTNSRCLYPGGSAHTAQSNRSLRRVIFWFISHVINQNSSTHPCTWQKRWHTLDSNDYISMSLSLLNILNTNGTSYANDWEGSCWTPWNNANYIYIWHLCGVDVVVRKSTFYMSDIILFRFKCAECGWHFEWSAKTPFNNINPRRIR